MIESILKPGHEFLMITKDPKEKLGTCKVGPDGKPYIYVLFGKKKEGEEK